MYDVCLMKFYCVKFLKPLHLWCISVLQFGHIWRKSETDHFSPCRYPIQPWSRLSLILYLFVLKMYVVSIFHLKVGRLRMRKVGWKMGHHGRSPPLLSYSLNIFSITHFTHIYGYWCFLLLLLFWLLMYMHSQYIHIYMHLQKRAKILK